MNDDVETFDLTGPLPTGTALLEASAGTGKTFTIAGLVARWVAETSLRLPQLLVVTFTRAATAELRDRVRQRLVGAAEHLESLAAGGPRSRDDPVLAVLGAGRAAERELRLRRLRRALTEIDVATISTIHGFCQHVLDGLGTASDLDREAELVDHLHDLLEEVVDDLLVTTYLQRGDQPRLGRDDLLELGRVVVANPTTTLTPQAPADPRAGLRVRMAREIRDEVERRARRQRLLSYDDLLTRLAATLADPDRGASARQALRQRYRATLIDEFQDTDPIQWSILSRAFAGEHHDGRALVLIGDPKQAIYAFRGADVYAYLDAADRAARRFQLGTCWRSDADLLTAFEALFEGARFGDEGIVHRSITPAPGHEQPRLLDAPVGAALRLRVVPRHRSLGLYRDKPSAPKVRELIAADVAADIVRLLSAHPTIVDRDHGGQETARRPLDPRHIAVLVRSNDQAGLVQEALRDVGVPAVVGGVASVFTTPAATDWQRLVEALERPASATRVRALALTCWIGWTADEVADAPDADWDELHEDVHRWARLLLDRGVATMLRTVLLQRRVQPRLLRREGGERQLADLEHIGELLHAAATAEHLGATSLAAWLAERIAEAGSEQHDDQLRRLETDDEAVQILTIHRSKGLEFPVVYCPYLWSSSTKVRGAPVFHDDDRNRLIDVGGESHDGYAASAARSEQESRGEELRLTYVALTRAAHQVVAWYAPAGWPEWSGLGRLLLCRDEDGSIDTEREAPLPTDEEALAAAERLAARADGAVAVESVPEEPPRTVWEPPATDEAPLRRARFERGLDTSWRRTSYSALIRLDDPEPRVGSEADEQVKDDEALPDDVVQLRAVGDPDPHRLREVPLPLGELPGGTEIGTFVHLVLERTDFAAPDLPAELERVVADELARRRLELDPSLLVAGLDAAIRTPLGPSAGGITLREVSRPDRRDEVGFELPLDRAATGRPATVADIAGLMRHHLAPDDPLIGYPDEIPPALLRRDLRGYLGGSIDLLLRRHRPDRTPIFHVIDHKTNRLGRRGTPLTAWDHRPHALAEAMVRGHYPIQALLYSVAAHRLLRWRLTGYDPARHLGSVLYLFVRGMIGPRTPAPDGRPCGVFAWQPPVALVIATSDLLHGRVAA